MHSQLQQWNGRALQAINQRWLLIAFVAAYCALSLFRLGYCDLESDEGRFGLSAVNIVTDYHQLARVSEDPLGGPGTKPFMYPLSLVPFISVLGHNEFALRAFSVIAILLATFFIAAAVRLLAKDRELAAVVFAVMLLNPASISYARTAMPEPAVLLWGAAAFYFATKLYFAEKRVLGLAALTGILLGCGYLSKLWLILPFGLACAVLFIGRFMMRRDGESAFAALLAFAVFAATASLHLAAVFLLTPGEAAYWMNMYLGTTLKERVKGGGFDVAMWFRPWWFYFGAIFKVFFYVLPLMIVGLFELVRRRSYLLVAIVLSFLAHILLLSAFQVKEAAYVYPAYPGLVLCVAFGWRRVLREGNRRWLAAAAVFSVVLAAFFFRNGVLPLPEFAAIAFLFSGYVLWALLPILRVPSAMRFATAALVAAMILVAMVAVTRSLDHRTYYREIGNYFSGVAHSKQPQDVVFVAPEYPAMEFYLYRSGQYWQTAVFTQTDSAFSDQLLNGAYLFYVVDPSAKLYGSSISAAKSQMLKAYTREVTKEVARSAGHEIPLKIFVGDEEHLREAQFRGTAMPESHAPARLQPIGSRQGAESGPGLVK